MMLTGLMGMIEETQWEKNFELTRRGKTEQRDMS